MIGWHVLKTGEVQRITVCSGESADWRARAVVVLARREEMKRVRRWECIFPFETLLGVDPN
jgi:hypothetical protein